MTKEIKRVVITGMGAITPLGNSVTEFWNNIIAGKSGVDFRLVSWKNLQFFQNQTKSGHRVHNSECFKLYLGD